jgi:hypothetical protein
MFACAEVMRERDDSVVKSASSGKRRRGSVATAETATTENERRAKAEFFRELYSECSRKKVFIGGCISDNKEWVTSRRRKSALGEPETSSSNCHVFYELLRLSLRGGARA